MFITNFTFYSDVPTLRKRVDRRKKKGYSCTTRPSVLSFFKNLDAPLPNVQRQGRCKLYIFYSVLGRLIRIDERCKLRRRWVKDNTYALQNVFGSGTIENEWTTNGVWASENTVRHEFCAVSYLLLRVFSPW